MGFGFVFLLLFCFCVASCRSSAMVNRCIFMFMDKRNVYLNALVNWGLSELISFKSVIFKMDLNLFEITA